MAQNLQPVGAEIVKNRDEKNGEVPDKGMNVVDNNPQKALAEMVFIGEIVLQAKIAELASLYRRMY